MSPQRVILSEYSEFYPIPISRDYSHLKKRGEKTVVQFAAFILYSSMHPHSSER